ncbi:MAG: glutamate 5-kinase, partial [Muribaculaceae bacterium]|nr:glutamate 5-kinase [Muribaculaceae bacterium]
EEGVRVIIAKGERRNVLIDLLENPDRVPHTEFSPREEGLSTVKRWIAHSSSFAKGRLIVDENAEKALRGDSAVSLLPIGVIEAEGEWEEGDIVNIYGRSGGLIGVGRSSVSSELAKDSLGQRGGRPLVHYDYLYIE